MNLDELHGETALQVPAAPRMYVDQALQLSAKEFFRESKAWRVMTDPLVFGDDDEYEISAPFNTEIVEPIKILVDGIPMRSDQWTAVEEGEFGGIVVHFFDRPYKMQFMAELAVTLATGSREIPNRLGREFRDGIIHGALARMLRVPNTDWTDLNLSGFHQGMFLEAIDRAATRVENGMKLRRTRVVRYGGL